MKPFYKCNLIWVLTALTLSSASASAKLKVVATTPDLAAITREVGGNLIEVTGLVRPDQEPHSIEPKPSYSVILNQADLLIEVGLELESGWLPVLLTQSRNPKIQPGQKGHLNASQGIRVLEVPTGRIDRSMGDVHPDGNPHYTLDPRNGLIIVQAIEARLSELDPANAAAYAANRRAFVSRLTPKIAAWEKHLAPIKGKRLITFHKDFTYFMDWSGLVVADVIEPRPGIPPSPAHILSLVERIKSEKIPLIATENFCDPKPGRELSSKTGVSNVRLPAAVGGDGTAPSYEGLFDAIVSRLTESLKEAP